MKNLLSTEAISTDQMTPEVSLKAAQILKDWKSISNEARWFDDSLNNIGLKEANSSGKEVGEWLRCFGLETRQFLFVTSPFRRAWQTQLVACGSAGLGVPGISGAASSQWVAHDGLSETPFSESSCIRSPRQEIARWQPCLDVSLIKEECEVFPETHLDVEWQAMLKFRAKRAPAGPTTQQQEENSFQSASQDDDGDQRNDIEDAVISRAGSFVQWLLGRPEDVVWVVTHQVTGLLLILHTETKFV
jgi:hypothetical protein